MFMALFALSNKFCSAVLFSVSVHASLVRGSVFSSLILCNCTFVDTSQSKMMKNL